MIILRKIKIFICGADIIMKSRFIIKKMIVVGVLVLICSSMAYAGTTYKKLIYILLTTV